MYDMALNKKEFFLGYNLIRYNISKESYAQRKP